MFFKELLTESEIDVLSKRWRILEMLNQGKTQREIAKELQVSLCKVTRGAKILKNKSSMLAKYMAKIYK
jgi:TrpR family trp operon transcriptional repressor